MKSGAVANTNVPLFDIYPVCMITPCPTKVQGLTNVIIQISESISIIFSLQIQTSMEFHETQIRPGVTRTDLCFVKVITLLPGLEGDGR
jgi:hypothetical protein